MKVVNGSCSRSIALSELKGLLNELMTGEVRVADIDLSPLAAHTHGLPS